MYEFCLEGKTNWANLGSHISYNQFSWLSCLQYLGIKVSADLSRLNLKSLLIISSWYNVIRCMFWNILPSLFAFVLGCYFDPFEFCRHLELNTIIFTVVYFSTVITCWLLYGFIWRNKSLDMCRNKETSDLYWDITACYIELTWCNLYYRMDFCLL